MQLVAYKNSEWLYPKTDEPCALTLDGPECTCERIPMPKIDRLAVLDLKPDRWEMVYVSEKGEDVAWDAFRGCLAQQQLKKHKRLFVPYKPRSSAPVERPAPQAPEPIHPQPANDDDLRKVVAKGDCTHPEALRAGIRCMRCGTRVAAA